MPEDRQVVTVRPQGTHLTKQQLLNFEGISGATAGVPHQPINLSDTEQVIAVVARNDPNEQESVVLYEMQSPASATTA